jgi:hypothetical protein
LRLIALVCLAVVTLVSAPGRAADGADIPAWLIPHVGTGQDQIAPVVLERARALYQKRVQQGTVKNPCYFAKDATRPHTLPSGMPAGRFYIICEEARSFRAVSSGHGNGRKLKQANFANERVCARNFSNAEGSKLTMGGEYLTAETRTSFKGYYSRAGKAVPFNRTFLLFDGVGETSNARKRAIGGHLASFLRWQCRMERPQSRYADDDGFVPYGKLVNYSAGRSNGCTTWTGEATEEILDLVEGNPTTLYIYPESKDIVAVAKAVSAKVPLPEAGVYWNATCLKEIGAPKFWPKRKLEPVINAWRRSLPKQPPLELPLCR